MDAVSVVVVAVATAAAIGVVAWFYAARRHPERASRHDHDQEVRGSEAMFGEVHDRPGDPGTEIMDPDGTASGTPPGTPPQRPG